MQWNSGALVALGWSSVDTIIGKDGAIGEPGGEELIAVQADGCVVNTVYCTLLILNEEDFSQC